MDCHKIKKLIPLYLDHELSAADYQQVETHLQNCTDCKSEARVTIVGLVVWIALGCVSKVCVAKLPDVWLLVDVLFLPDL